MPQPSVLRATLFARCPRCGSGPLFNGYLTVPPRCASCGLDYSRFDVGDGASVFVVLIAGFLVTGSALIVEVKYSPPYWVHAVLWLPLIALLVGAGLRLVKAFLMVQQYRHQAHEGRIEG
ncbi:MAG TPA: DUF983 domain-containing protein [Rhizomicrobium sp.]|nr:DUF983 domain-containing protein [Rhizomicrobium sp.]